MFHARPLDRTQYDKDILQKQMDLETMRITLKEEDSRMRDTFLIEYEGQCGDVAYTRKITREANEEGKWRRLISEIEDMAFKYGVEFEEALKIFESVSCCKKSLKLALEKNSYVSWSELDDLGLKDVDSAEYKHLVK